MKIGKKSLGLAALTLSAGLLLSACGNGGNDDNASQSVAGKAPATGPASGSAGGASSLSGKVYVILPDTTTVRYEKFDRPNIVAAMKKLAPKVQVEVLNSNNQAATQVNQVQTAITAGAKAIILTSVDPDQAAANLNAAAAAKIPVVCMAHVCNGGPAYAYLSVPFVEIGQQQAKATAAAVEAKFAKTGKPLRLAEMFGDPAFPFYTDQVKGFNQYLNPLIKAGKLKVVCKADALQWEPRNAQTNMDQCLTKANNGVDAILAMNDDTGGGALAAVSSAGLKNIPLFGGYDATLAGVQRVAAGVQPLDMTTDYVKFDTIAARLAVAAAQGQPIPSDLGGKKYDNKYKSGITEIDSQNARITAANLDSSVVQAKLFTKSQICSNSVATKSAYCAK